MSGSEIFHLWLSAMPVSYFLLLMTLIFLLVSSNKANYEEIEFKTLDPLELIDLVLKEQKLAVPDPLFGSTSEHSRNIRKVNRMFSVPHIIRQTGDMEKDPTTTTATVATVTNNGDAELLTGRKVWSRWSKWGVCSVSCGTGIITRRRVCLAGRCASGEREEQRRPCTRPPCSRRRCPTHADDARTLLYDLHDLD